jgi:CO/xanthine dehydrogenase Mo-binding subunit
MREFGPMVGAPVRAQITELARSMFVAAEPKRAVTGAEFAMDEHADDVVVREAEWRGEGGQRLRIAATESTARPPFEWLYEITSDVGEADYFKHYLVREGDIVLAQRKVLTPIDEAEAAVILADLRTVQSWGVGNFSR